MDRVILIKYGELTTKKGNRKFFINTLYQNIQKKLKKLPVKISKLVEIFLECIFIFVMKI